MKKFALLPIIALAGPAFASADCEDMERQAPMWEIAKRFEDAGGEIVLMKVTDEKCYEIYGRQGDKKLEIYYSPTDGAELEREES